jgi:hypothetical protein
MAYLIHAMVTPTHGQAPTRLTPSPPHPPLLPPVSLLRRLLGGVGQGLAQCERGGGGGRGRGRYSPDRHPVRDLLPPRAGGGLGGAGRWKEKNTGPRKRKEMDVQPCGWLLARRADSAPPPPNAPFPFCPPAFLPFLPLLPGARLQGVPLTRRNTKR